MPSKFVLNLFHFLYNMIFVKQCLKTCIGTSDSSQGAYLSFGKEEEEEKFTRYPGARVTTERRKEDFLPPIKFYLLG